MTKSSSKRNNNINKNSSLYDLDNFIINSYTTKSIGKHDSHIKIFTPNYKLIDNKFYLTPNFVISKPNENKELFHLEDEVIYIIYKGFFRRCLLKVS